MSGFLGVTVQCTLLDNTSVTGIVTAIDPVQGTLTLDTPTAAASIGKGKGKARQNGHNKTMTFKRDQVASLVVVQQQQQPSTEQEQDDDDETNEFDFTAGLSKFDKAKEFEMIRSLDTVDPELRLHAHNKKKAPQAPAAPAIVGIREMVLTDQERQINNDGQDGVDVLTLLHRARQQQQQQEQGEQRDGHVSKTALEDVLALADLETGPSSSIRNECAASNLAHYLVSSHEQEGATTALVHLSSLVDVDHAVVAVRSLTHLINWGRTKQAWALVPADLGGQGGAEEQVRQAIRLFSSSGGRIIRRQSDLPSGKIGLVMIVGDGGTNGSTSVKADDVYSFGATNLATDATAVHLGAVVDNATSSKRTLLVDVGLPRSLWQRVSIEPFTIQNGAQLLIRQ